MRCVYLAGPYAAYDWQGGRQTEAANVQRAMLWHRRLIQAGHTVVCPHATIAAGGFGDDGIVAERLRGQQASLALLDLVIERGGGIVVLPRLDGVLSAGTQLEYDHYCRHVVDIAKHVLIVKTDTMPLPPDWHKQ